MKMKRFKVVVSFLLIMAMTLTMLAGCGKKSNESDKSTDAAVSTDAKADTKADAAASTKKDADKGEKAPVNLTAVFPGQESKAAESVLKAINEKLKADGLNVNVSIKYIDDYWNKLALDIAGGAEYDIAWAHSSTLSDLVSKKVYQPIDDALKAYGADLLANTPEHVLKGGSVGGKQYALPRSIPMTAFNNVFNIRGDLREKYGIPEIKTIEDLEAYFAAIKENEPDMYPIMDTNWQPLFPVYADYFFPIGDGGINPIYIDPTDETYTVKSFWDSEAFTQITTKRKEWKEKGWLNSDTSKVENGDVGFDYGKVACVAANIMRASERIDTITANVPGAVVETVLLEPKTRHIYLAGDNMLAVPSTSKHVNEAVALINWIKKSQENYDLWSYGVEGENYKLVDGAVDISDIPKEKVYTTNVWMWNDINLARFSSKYPKEDIEKLKTWDSKSVVTPFVGFTLDQSKIKAQVSQVTAVMNEYSLNLAIGVTDINEVRDEIMKKMNAAGLQDIIEETQKQINAYIAAK
ncbi:hypothetical protein CDQ84_10035 [Clostridium thermosuccinogenes]|jgi:putative aldouronate transport system substrate-binding protein|uniref:DUF3502 domain-containing protein n=2 Tax=Clostridium thermosuccinogenes TaxID=84032 RepID=A0A2K2FE00_9CLOT|nr:hypothetical protein CDO33_10545 [Pseudoclostridium thermosuccinogenes]PNT92495.1 hypothetical protein CDQ83_02695 [Pseudoclostridium thermosuccinogenes]PNT97011.1 hypothetical protein CDQ85_09885 [Pseudoclostridium thermosuccinogenes]PNT98870.1 hypothetical protein CDQ84_10035 [Pseudoclostridium thermosuccinogenes]